MENKIETTYHIESISYNVTNSNFKEYDNVQRFCSWDVDVNYSDGFDSPEDLVKHVIEVECLHKPSLKIGVYGSVVEITAFYDCNRTYQISELEYYYQISESEYYENLECESRVSKKVITLDIFKTTITTKLISTTEKANLTFKL